MKPLTVRISVKNLPPRYTCDGGDISPPLEVDGIEENGIASLALMMTDADAPGGGTAPHWLIWNMDVVSIVPEDIKKELTISFPMNAVQGKNIKGGIGYAGPCPPDGQSHRYEIKVYGLDTMLDLAPGVEREDLIRAMQGHVVQFGATSVIYGR